ncbi:MAG: hypothetical protein J6F30_00735, partial [Cellulosilyticum sp.]|nr:hypothetical protein [Cellulosilyticum sp.]
MNCITDSYVKSFFEIRGHFNQSVIQKNGGGIQQLDFNVGDKKLTTIELNFPVYQRRISDTAHKAILTQSSQVLENGNIRCCVTVTRTSSILSGSFIMSEIESEKDIATDIRFIPSTLTVADESDYQGYEYTKETGELKILLPVVEPEDDPLVITYETAVDQEILNSEQSPFNMTTYLYIEDEEMPISEKVSTAADILANWISITAPKQLHPAVDGTQVQVEWTITVNANNRRIEGATIIDDLPKYLSYVEGSATKSNLVEVSPITPSIIQAETENGVQRLSFDLGDIE